MRLSVKALLGLVAALTLFVAVVVSAQRDAHPNSLTVRFLNVGQGDAAFIETPGGRQILIDGGPNRAVLRELGGLMPWWDRTIDMIIATHPDADHVSGLVDVLDRYAVTYIIEPGVEHDTPQAESMLRAVANEGAEHVLARRGDIYDFGDGVSLEILFPDRDTSGWETNTASIVARLVYGSTSLLFTGDSPESVERYLVGLEGSALQSTVLKAGHHGSRTSSSLLFVGAVAPTHAVYSRGCDNEYGHPHPEVVDTFSRFDVEQYDTCKEGTVTFVSDGQVVYRE